MNEETLNWELALYALLYEEYGDVGQNGNITNFIKEIFQEREKELVENIKQYFKSTTNRGDNIGEYLARNVIFQEDILEIIRSDNSLPVNKE